MFICEREIYCLCFKISLATCSCMTLEQKLEQTREELQTATEAESTLRNRCACLEEKQRQKKDQIVVAPHNIIL